MAFERLLNSVHETHIVFENLSNIDGDMLQEPWGLNFGEGGITGCAKLSALFSFVTSQITSRKIKLESPHWSGFEAL